MPRSPHLDHDDNTAPPGAPGGMSISPIKRQIVQWENGIPIVKGVPMFTRAQISEIALAAASMPYEDPNDALAIELGLPPSEFYGMTNLEVMFIRQARAAAAGDSEAREALIDRIAGKPKTTAEVVKTTLTYEDRIKEIAARRAQDARIITDAGGDVL